MKEDETIRKTRSATISWHSAILARVTVVLSLMAGFCVTTGAHADSADVSAQALKGPVKTFDQAMQSNMVGHAKVTLNGGEPAAKAPGRKTLRINFAMGQDGRLTRDQFLVQNATDDPQIRKRLEEVFDHFDTNHTGMITMNQFIKVSRLQSSAETPAPPAGPDDEPEAEPAWPDTAAIFPAAEPCPYAVVISSTAAARPKWKAVADALVAKHKGVLVVYSGSVYNALPDLARLRPRYTAFVARTEILGRVFVARVHRLTRRMGDEPFTGTVWGIVSGDTPQTALRVAQATAPAIIHSVISLTGVSHQFYDEVFTLSDGKAGDWLWKHSGGTVDQGNDGDADRVELFVKHFSEDHPEAIVTSGHATEKNLEMPFSEGNTEIRDGKWVGIVNWRRRDAEERVLPIPEDDRARIFLGPGNCLIGNFHKRADSIAAVLMGRYGVNQFIGYTVPTWFGKGGWGTLGAWQNFAGTYSLAEAFFFNNQALTHEFRTRFPALAETSLKISEQGEGFVEDGSAPENRDAHGMLWDRDVVAFYGDPAMRVTLDPAKNSARPRFTIHEAGDHYQFEATAEQESAGLVAMLFPHRIDSEIEVTAGQEYAPIVSHNFILIPNASLKPGKPLRVEFVARRKIALYPAK